MIKKIFLKSFGRFQGQGFDCERTTVFHGPNESGKTTLFDAIFKVLCRPSKSTAEGKRLEERYGQGEAEVTFAGEPLAPDRRDFLYLHAIRAGDVTFGDQWTAKWRNGLESQVLTAGVDVEAAAVSLESLASHGPPESSAALDRLRAEQAQKQRALDELVAKREVLLGAGSRSSELDTRVQDAKERLELHQQTVRKLADDLERDTEARRRQTLQSELEAVQRRLLQIEQQENLGAFTEDRSGELAALEEAIATAQKEQAVARSKRDESEKQRATANSLVQKLEAQLDETMTRADQATLAQRKLEEARDQTVTRTVWRPDMLFAALAAAAACAVAWFAIGDNVGMGMALVGALAALGFTITAKHTFEEDDREEQTRICQREQAKWNARAPEGMRTTADTLDGLKSFFARQSVTVKTVEEEIAHARREAKEFADKLLKAEDGLRARTEAVQVAQDKLQQWLDDLGIKTKHEYASRRAQLEALAKDSGDEASSLSDLDRRPDALAAKRWPRSRHASSPLTRATTTAGGDWNASTSRPSGCCPARKTSTGGSSSRAKRCAGRRKPRWPIYPKPRTVSRRICAVLRDRSSNRKENGLPPLWQPIFCAALTPMRSNNSGRCPVRSVPI